jgi:hypothetical protein
MSPNKIERIKQALCKPVERDVLEDLSPDRFLSTGSTCLNLACTGHPDKGFVKGKFYWFVGDSDSGKTFLTLTCLAEASINPSFDDYRFVYDAPEGGALMDIERFFGPKVAQRLEAPRYDEEGNREDSETIQEFYFNLDDSLKKSKPFIYVLDSLDGLTSREEINQFDKVKAAMRKGKKEVTGSFGGEIAKWNSRNLRKLMGPLKRSGSILIVVSQTRDSYSLFESSTVAGGRALKFFATLQLWSTQVGKIKREVNGKERELGTYCKVRVKKNRVVGRDRSVVVPVYHSAGVDDVGGMVDYLVAEKVWKKEKETQSENASGGKIVVTGLGPERIMRREEIVRMVEEENMEDDLKALVVDAWNAVEEACKIHRKSRYH